MSFRRAFREVGAAPGVYLVVAVLAAISLISEAATTTTRSWPTVLYVVFSGGYSLSLSHGVVSGRTPVLPPLGRIGTHLRRSLAALLLSLPLFAVALLPLAVGLAIAVEGSAHLAKIATGVLLAADAAVAGLACIGPVPRYLAFDRLREGFRYIDAAKRMWRCRRQALSLIAFVVASGMVFFLLSYLLKTALGASDFPDLNSQIGAIGRHGLTVLGVVAVFGVVVRTVAATFAFLVTAHLVGQYAAIAFATTTDAGVSVSA